MSWKLLDAKEKVMIKEADAGSGRQPPKSSATHFAVSSPKPLNPSSTLQGTLNHYPYEAPSRHEILDNPETPNEEYPKP